MNPMARRAPMDNTTVILKYRGQMVWSKQFGIDSRMWDVISPKLKTYDYRSGGYPTLTIEGLKERGII